MKTSKLIRLSGLAGLLMAALAGCTQTVPDTPLPPPPVAVMTVTAVNLELTEDLVGRVAAVRTAEIRPQVTGIVQRLMFEQGSEVRAGQPLFQINAAPFKADADTASAALQRAEAVMASASAQVDRLKPLAESEAVSLQAYDDALSAREQAKASVAQARAELTRRRLDLAFATVDAPISGRVDQAQMTEGALVGPSDATPLARIQQIDQVYVDVRQPAAQLESIRRLAGKSDKNGSGSAVAILDGDGKPMDIDGRILFSGISVNEGTGDVLVRIAVENKGRRLLPGMFVRARVVRARFENAIAVPQQAVVRAGSQARIWLLEQGSKVRSVPVELGELIGDSYRVRTGLKAEDRVIVEGLDRMSADVTVTPREWRTATNGERHGPVGVLASTLP